MKVGDFLTTFRDICDEKDRPAMSAKEIDEIRQLSAAIPSFTLEYYRELMTEASEDGSTASVREVEAFRDRFKYQVDCRLIDAATTAETVRPECSTFDFFAEHMEDILGTDMERIISAGEVPEIIVCVRRLVDECVEIAANMDHSAVYGKDAASVAIQMNTSERATDFMNEITELVRDSAEIERMAREDFEPFLREVERLLATV